MAVKAKIDHFATCLQCPKTVGFKLFFANLEQRSPQPLCSAELIRAMDLLLQCNMKLVSSGLDESLVLQQTLTQIVRKEEVAK